MIFDISFDLALYNTYSAAIRQDVQGAARTISLIIPIFYGAP